LAGNARTTIVGSQLDRALVLHSGGAAFIRDNSSLTVLKSTAHANYAQHGGGFFCSGNSTMTIAHSVLRGNAALKQGGAIQAVEQCKVSSCISVLNSAEAHVVCTSCLPGEAAGVFFIAEALQAAKRVTHYDSASFSKKSWDNTAACGTHLMPGVFSSGAPEWSHFARQCIRGRCNCRHMGQHNPERCQLCAAQQHRHVVWCLGIERQQQQPPCRPTCLQQQRDKECRGHVGW
jgi:hypothetical protein